MSLARLLILMAVSTAVTAGEPARALSFLMPTGVQREDLDGLPIGGGWYALHPTGETWSLDPDQIKVLEGYGEYDIQSQYEGTEALLRFRGIQGGPVEAASLEKSKERGQRVLLFRGNRYQLVTHQKKGTSYNPDYTRNIVYLSHNGQERLIFGKDESESLREAVASMGRGYQPRRRARLHCSLQRRRREEFQDVPVSFEYR
jgi:hypothetical protein